MVEIIEGTEEEIGSVGTKPVAGGTILGIHNLAIVIPQFLVSRCNRSPSLGDPNSRRLFRSP